MIVHVFLTLVKSKVNSSNDNPYDQWIVLATTNWIGNQILVIIWDWFLPNFFQSYVQLMSNLVEIFLYKGE
jgi:hypothetical protein